jgi:hypothetical protein
MSRRRRSPTTNRVSHRVAVPAPRPSCLATWSPAVVVAFGGALTYLNSLFLPFLFDDRSAIVENVQIQDLWRVDVLSPARERANEVAFASALIWVLHPLNSEVVDYLTQRTESLMALFFLLTFYASFRAVTDRRIRWTILAVASCALGMGSKESMVTAPVVIILFDSIFVFDSFLAALRKRGRLYLGLSMTWLILAALLLSGPRRRSAGFWTGISPWTYLLNQPPLLARLGTRTPSNA